MMAEEINKIIDKDNDPLEQTKSIAKVIDTVLLIKDKKNRKRYNVLFPFNQSWVKKPSFFSFLR